MLAPLLPSVLFFIALHPQTVRVTVLMLVLSILFSYVPCLLLGLPLIKVLEKRRSLSIVRLAVGGALIGAVVFCIFGFVLSGLLGSVNNAVSGVRELLSGAVLGLLVAALFGVIAGFPLFVPNTTEQ